MQPIEMQPIDQGGTTVLLGRLTDLSNTPLVQVDIASITVKSYDTGDIKNPVAETTPSVASVIFDTLRPWPTIPGFTAPDDVGYNVKYETPTTFFPQGGRKYQVELKATLQAGNPRTQIWRQPTTDLFQQ
jgi:hypothetical protein